MNDNEFSVYSDEELKTIYNCLTRTQSGYMRIKKETIKELPKETFLDSVMIGMEKEYNEMVEKAVNKIIK